MGTLIELIRALTELLRESKRDNKTFKHNNNQQNNQDKPQKKPRMDNYCDQAMWDADAWKRGEMNPLDEE